MDTHDKWVSTRCSEIIADCRRKLIDVTTVVHMRSEQIITDNERMELELMKSEIELLLSLYGKRKVV